MSDWNAIQAFMAHVVPWPQTPADPGFVNLHFSSVDRKDPTKLYKGGGWPFRSVESFIGRASWINTTDQFKDVWYCLSLQSQVKPNPRTPAKPKAQRLAANALSVKSLWIDADVGPKAGEYPTLEAALKALILFREKHKLPPYSALVASGGGLHGYWISKSALTVREWAPYAEGLRALLIQDKLVKDPGITTDVARILRVPGTFNHKTTPPKPVLLLNTPLVMYDFAVDLVLLPTVAPAVSTVQVNKPEQTLFADGADMASFKAPPVLAAVAGDTLGTQTHEDMSLDPRPIFTNCGFYREALRIGGADYDNALWMYSVLGATFMENGNAIAHQISKGHPTYSEVDTQALYDRKVAERADRGIGYPSCAAIAGAGCKSCASCPLFAKGKSPLNIRPVVPATVNGAALNMALPSPQSQSAQSLHLPLGYDVDEDGCICEVEEVQISGETMPPKLHRLFYSRLSKPWAQSNPDALNFTTTVDLGQTFNASILHSEMNGLSLNSVWGPQHIKIYPKNKGRLEHFIVSWLAKLHEMQAAQQSLPFGWYRVGDDYKGFVFDGRLMKDDGSETPCGSGDPELRGTYQATGDPAHWFTACNTITAMRRPELDAIIALSFAAPLAALVGRNAVSMSAYGDSGARKSAAYAVGISVWGHGTKAKQTSESTFNGIIRTMGELSNLPLYWDEIKEGDPQKVVYKYLFTAGDGVEKARMKDGSSLQKRGIWQTMMMLASNLSFADYVLTRDQGHTAGLSRVFEYFVKKLDTGPGLISPTDADMIFAKLNTSYGHMGLRYGKLLAMNHDAIQKEATATCRAVEIDLKTTGEERFWVSLVGLLIVGARLANELGATMDLPALKTFLYKTFLLNRKKRNDLASIAHSKYTIVGNMNAFLQKAETNDQMLWTRGMPQGPGKPATVSLLHQPKDLRNVAVQMAVSTRWDISSGKLYIAKSEFETFMNASRLPYGTTITGLTDEFKMEIVDRVTLGAGVFSTGLRITCLVIDVAKNAPEWMPMLHKYTPADERPSMPEIPPDAPPAPAAAPPTERADTGFEYDATTGLASADSVGNWVRGAKRHA